MIDDGQLLPMCQKETDIYKRGDNLSVIIILIGVQSPRVQNGGKEKRNRLQPRGLVFSAHSCKGYNNKEVGLQLTRR